MKIAIIDKFCNTPYGFSKDIVNYLKDKHEVSWLNSINGNLSQYDFVHFDWADELAIQAIDRGINARVTVRLHAYELHDGFANRIQWDRVDCLILVSEHYKKHHEHQQHQPTQSWKILLSYLLVVSTLF